MFGFNHTVTHLRGKSSAEVVWRPPCCKVSTDGIENQDRQQGNPHVSFQGTHLFLGCSIMMLDCGRVVTKAEKSVENVRVESSRGQFARWSSETVNDHGLWSSDWVKGGETG